MPKIKLRAVERDDRERVVALCRSDFGRFADHLDLIWNWLLFASPWRSSIESPGWVLETGARKIVGFLGVFVQPYQVAGQTCVAAGATTFVVDREFRFHGLQLAREAMRPGRRIIPMSTTASPDAARVFAAMGAQPAPEGSLSWIRPMDLAPVLKTVASRRFPDRRSRALANGAAVVAGSAATLLHGLARTIRDPKIGHPASRVSARELAGIDELWSRLGPRFSWTCERSEEFINWRCFEHPARNFAVLIARSSRVDGFAIVRNQDRGSAGRALEIVDFFADPLDTETCDRLLAACVDLAKDEEASFIEFKWGAAGFEPTMKRWGFIARDYGYNPCLWVSPRDVLIASFPSDDVWHRTAIDGDAAI